MKKIFAFVLAMVMVATLFGGCSAREENDSEVESEYADLVQIPGYDYLCYSTTDQTVYYLFVGYKKGFFGPYIRNGHYCEYIDGHIVEVVPIEEVAD